MIVISDHALRRFNERIAAVGNGEARRRILEHRAMILTAIEFGAPCVKCADGMRIMVKGSTVTTVFGPDMRLGRAA